MLNLPSLRFTWNPFYAYFKREVRRFFKVPFQTLLAPLITAMLYLLIFGISIGRELSSIYNFNYLAFLIPGLVMMGVLRNTFDNSASSMITAKFWGELEDLRITPLSPTQIIWGSSLGAIVRGFIVGGITLFIGEAFYWLTFHNLVIIEHPILLLSFIILGGLAFASLGLSIAMFATTIDQVSALNNFILLPLIYLGGIFFSLDHLHAFWQNVAKFNPLLYLINGVRYSILGMSDVSLTKSLLVTILTFLFFHFIALRSLQKGSYHRW